MRADGVCAGESLRYDESVMSQPSQRLSALSRRETDAEHVKAIDVEDVACGISRERSSLVKPLVLMAKGEPKGSLARFGVLANNHQSRRPLQKGLAPTVFSSSPNVVTVAKEGR